ncbi:Hsp20/alpha crystallin family protein [Nakamurella leprariae]|uniref:Hsp20/alpha crystallin family protein n=1 Tax=Nakamurella leprariae TaxID=2803911 RepID=A0A938YF38_9ACTN|nr:Hsp20/alpha crystallin family protein [Nakamurella leprariae]MBM9468381.1 Hsp20/alpha crystallin family protein [Nakamurella leprariae]
MLGFDPFRDVEAFRRLAMGTVENGRTPRFMPMDVVKVDDHFVVLADLPGVDPGSVDLDVDHNTLTIRAHRTAAEHQGGQWLTNERFAGSYLRQLSLGDGVDTERISANYANGVLTVIIPIAERAKQRRIPIDLAETPTSLRASTVESRSADGPSDRQVEAGSSS